MAEATRGDPFEKLPDHLLVHILTLGLQVADLHAVRKVSRSLEHAADQIMSGGPPAETPQVSRKLMAFYDKYFGRKAEDLPKRVARYIMDRVAEGAPYQKADFTEEFRADLDMAQIFLGAFSKQLVNHASSVWGQATQQQAEKWRQSLEQQGRRARRASWWNTHKGDMIVVNNRSGLTPVKCTSENITAYIAGRDLVAAPPPRNEIPPRSPNKRPLQTSSTPRASPRFERFSDIDLPKTVYGVYLAGPGKGPCLYAFADGRNLLKRMPERGGRPDVLAFCPTRCILRFFQKCWEAHVNVRFVLPPPFISSKDPQELLPSQDPADIIQDGEYTRHRWLYTLQESHLIVPVKSKNEADDVQVLELTLDMVYNKGKESTVIFSDDHYYKHWPKYPQLNIDDLRQDVSYNPNTKELFSCWLQQRWRKFNPMAAAQAAAIAEQRIVPADQELAFSPASPYVNDLRSPSPTKSSLGPCTSYPFSSSRLVPQSTGPDSPYPPGFESPQKILSPPRPYRHRDSSTYGSPSLRADNRLLPPVYSSPTSYFRAERSQLDYDSGKENHGEQRRSSHEIGRFSDSKDTNKSYPTSSSQERKSRDSSKRLSFGTDGPRQRISPNTDDYGQRLKYETDEYRQLLPHETDSHRERSESRKQRDSKGLESPKDNSPYAGRPPTDVSSHRRSRNSDSYRQKSPRQRTSRDVDFYGHSLNSDTDGYRQPASLEMDSEAERNYEFRKQQDSKGLQSPKGTSPYAGRPLIDGSSHKRARNSESDSHKSYGYRANDSPVPKLYDTSQGREDGSP